MEKTYTVEDINAWFDAMTAKFPGAAMQNSLRMVRRLMLAEDDDNSIEAQKYGVDGVTPV